MLAVALVFGADADDVLALGVPAVVATVLVAAAETGRLYIQASAYGDEQRFGLRPPLGYLTAVVTTWLIWVSAVITTPLAWAAAAWVPAVVASVVAVAGASTLPRRWHQLSRRWLVFVPAGLVVHDPVVLADALMLPRRTVAAVEANELGHGTAATAVDLTGPTPGLAVEIRLRQPVTAVLARRPTEPRGTPVQCAAVLVSPTRPGAVLTEARRRLDPSRPYPGRAPSQGANWVQEFPGVAKERAQISGRRCPRPARRGRWGRRTRRSALAPRVVAARAT